MSVRVGVTTDQLDHVRVLSEDDRSARLDVTRCPRSRPARVSDEAVAQQVPANSGDVDHARRSAPVERHLAAEPARSSGSECKLQDLLLPGRQSKWDRWRTDEPERSSGQADALHRARYAPDVGYHHGRLGRDVGRLTTEIDDASGWDCNRGPPGQGVAERKVRHPADEVHTGQLRDDARVVVLTLGRHLQLPVGRTWCGRFVVDENRVAELIAKRDRERIVRFDRELVRTDDLDPVENDGPATPRVEPQIQALGGALADSHRIERDRLPCSLGHAHVFHGDRQLSCNRESRDGREEQDCGRFRKRVHVPTLVVNPERAHVASTP